MFILRLVTVYRLLILLLVEVTSMRVININNPHEGYMNTCHLQAGLNLYLYTESLQAGLNLYLYLFVYLCQTSYELFTIGFIYKQV